MPERGKQINDGLVVVFTNKNNNKFWEYYQIKSISVKLRFQAFLPGHEMILLIGSSFLLAWLRPLYREKHAKLNAALLCNPLKIKKFQYIK